MPDIIIYTNPKVLAHKRGVDGYQEYYWQFQRFPRGLKDCKRIFFAIKGFVVGSFKLEDFDPDNKRIVWNKNSWEELKEQVPTKHFQGFRYKWW